MKLKRTASFSQFLPIVRKKIKESEESTTFNSLNEKRITTFAYIFVFRRNYILVFIPISMFVHIPFPQGTFLITFTFQMPFLSTQFPYINSSYTV